MTGGGPGTPSPAAERGTGLVDASRLRFSYGEAEVLRGGDLRVAAGEIVALLGPNGAGKSTLIRLLMGELTPSAGSLTRPPTRTAAGRVSVGHAGEEAAHFDALSGRDNALFFARATGLRGRECEEAVSGLLEQLRLASDADEAVATYSFGARRKLLLLEALVHRPPLLLLDEPTVGLDARSREGLARLLEARREEGAGIVVSSHDLGFLEGLADRLVILHDGHVASEGRPSELLEALGTATRFEITLSEPLASAHELQVDGVALVTDAEAARSDTQAAGGRYTLVFETSRGQSALPELCAALVSAGAAISGVAVREPGLAELFRRVTGQELPR